MPNIKISDLQQIGAGFDPDAVFLEAQQTVAGEDVSRKMSVSDVTSGAGPLAATYVTVTANAILPNERILTGTANVLSVTDGGAGGNITLDIEASGIDNARLADMVQATVKGRIAGSGTGAPVDLTASQLNDILATGGFDAYFNLSATNRVLGSDAGASQTGDNVFLGMSGAGDDNIADNVIAIGVNALNAAVQLDFEGSIAIGTNAGLLIDDVNEPVLIIGFNAASAMPGASFHRGLTVIGHEALLNHSAAGSVQRNTFLGFRAGWKFGNASSLSNNVIIGNEAVGDGSVDNTLGLSNSVVIGNQAAGDIGGVMTGCIIIGEGAGESLNASDNTVIIGTNTAGNSGDNTNSVFIGSQTYGGTTPGENQVIIGGSTGGWVGGDDGVHIGATQGTATGQTGLSANIIIGTRAGNDLPKATRNFAIELPVGTGTGVTRPFLFGDLLESNLALLPPNATSDGSESGTRLLPTWGTGEGVFSMGGHGTDLPATTDADIVSVWIRNSDTALMLRYPGGDDISILHDGTDSIIDNSAGAMVFRANSVEGLRLTEDNSGVLQTPSASVAVTAFAGGGQGSATALIHSYNVITTVATAGDSVRLPDVFAINTLVYVKNDDAAEAADVFPASGDDLGAGVDTAVSLSPGSSLTFIATVANSTWTQLLSGTGAGVSGEFDNLLLSQAPGAHEASPTLRFGDGDTGFYETTDDLLRVSTAGTTRFFWQNETFGAANTTGPALLNEASGFANPNILPRRSDTDTGIGGSGTDQVSIICGGIGGTIWQALNSGMTVQNAVVENLTASTTQTQGNGVLVSSYNEVSTVSNDNDVVTLPTARAGQHCIIVNNGANTLQIFPGTSDDLGQGVNNSTTLAAGESAYFWCWDITTWMRIAVSIDWNGSQLLLPQENDATTPTLAFGDGNTGFYESADNTLNVALAGTSDFQFTPGQFQATNAAGAFMPNQAAGATTVTVGPDRADANTGLGSNAADQLSLIAGGLEMLRLVETGVAATDQVRIAQTIGGAAATPALAWGDGDTGFWENIDDVLNIGVGGSRVSVWTATQFAMDNASGPAIRNVTAAATTASLAPNKADLDTGVGWQGADVLSLVVGGLEMLRLAETGVSTTDQLIIGPAGVIGAVGTPSLAFGDGDSGWFESADDTVSLSTAGALAIVATGGADVALHHNGTEVARTDTTANGGFEVDAGDGFFRVLNLQNQELRRVDGDQGVANDATSNAVSDLTSTLTLAAGEHGIVEGMLRFESASATPGVRWQLDMSGAALTDSSVAWTLIIAGGTVEGDVDAADVDITHTMGANVEHVYKFFAAFTANAAILPTIAFAQETSNATQTRILDGSWVKYSVVP